MRKASKGADQKETTTKPKGKTKGLSVTGKKHNRHVEKEQSREQKKQTRQKGWIRRRVSLGVIGGGGWRRHDQHPGVMKTEGREAAGGRTSGDLGPYVRIAVCEALGGIKKWRLRALFTVSMTPSHAGSSAPSLAS